MPRMFLDGLDVFIPCVPSERLESENKNSFMDILIANTKFSNSKFYSNIIGVLFNIIVIISINSIFLLFLLSFKTILLPFTPLAPGSFIAYCPDLAQK